MKNLVSTLLIIFTPPMLFAQVTELPVNNAEQQLEQVTEDASVSENDDDAFLQEMAYFLKNPVDLNTATENELNALRVLNPLQVSGLIAYRRMLGSLMDIYEVQAVPGWDMQTIQKIRLYVTVRHPGVSLSWATAAVKGGLHSILLRAVQVLERSKGFGLDTASNANRYAGSPQKLLLRYRYAGNDKLQFGLTAEKDAGEQFFKGNQRYGFDFYSAHVFIRPPGLLKAIAIGDFTINMGQGLLQWQGMAFRKGPDIFVTKRQSEILRPYNSAGEFNFHRGLGFTLAIRKWELTLFGSFRKLDANKIIDGTLQDSTVVSSLQTSGYHRTQSEIADKAIQRTFISGGNLSWKDSRLQLGLNAVLYRFQYPLKKDDQPYNLFVQQGRGWANYSLDYSYTLRNMHFFGELATNGKSGLAMVNGLMISLSAYAEVSLLYRRLSRNYKSLFTNTFTENTSPVNENGLFAGISIRPLPGWQIDAYADHFAFPWLRYQVDAPSSGLEYFVQATYRPGRHAEFYCRYRKGYKAGNNDADENMIKNVVYRPLKNWRIQFSYKTSRQITIRYRAEMSWYDKNGSCNSRGFLVYTDLIYKPLLKTYAVGGRLQYFQADDYNSRLYAYENDVQNSFSIPAFYDKGYRYYLNVSYDFSKKLSCWARIAQTIYTERNTIGSGLDEIRGNRKTEVKIQIQYSF